MYTKLLEYQRNLRKEMPTPERLLWHRIRNEQLGVKFRRQYAIQLSSPLLQGGARKSTGFYPEGGKTLTRIFDFYAPQIKLAIEIDGDSHFHDETSRNKELQQDQYFLQTYGIKVLRFLNPEIMFSMEEVVEEIFRVIQTIPLPYPPPLQEGGNDTN